MSNVVAFKSKQKLDTVTYRTDDWYYDPKGHRKYPDFRVRGHHNLGANPFQTVDFEVHVKGRRANEHFSLTKQDVEALRDMFDDIASKMI